MTVCTPPSSGSDRRRSLRLLLRDAEPSVPTPVSMKRPRTESLFARVYRAICLQDPADDEPLLRPSLSGPERELLRIVDCLLVWYDWSHPETQFYVYRYLRLGMTHLGLPRRKTSVGAFLLACVGLAGKISEESKDNDYDKLLALTRKIKSSVVVFPESLGLVYQYERRICSALNWDLWCLETPYSCFFTIYRKLGLGGSKGGSKLAKAKSLSADNWNLYQSFFASRFAHVFFRADLQLIGMPELVCALLAVYLGIPSPIKLWRLYMDSVPARSSDSKFLSTVELLRHVV